MPRGIPKPVFVGTEDAAAFLGLTRETLKRWIWSGRPGAPAPQKVGAQLVFTLRQLNAYRKSRLRRWPAALPREVVLSSDETRRLLAERTGAAWSGRQLRHAIDAGDLPAVMIGRTRVFRREDVEVFAARVMRRGDLHTGEIA